ncbi:MAG TPA: PIN domain-containing protein [Planctomycetota bacterium]|nr:PIN domain-containing protein [Planctomycetota bacterium]
MDTSSWIEAFRRKGDPAVRARVRTLLANGEAAWCDLVRLELWNGASGESERRTLRQYEQDLPCLETTRDVWLLSFDIARRTRSAGLTIPATDLVILACARHHRAALDPCDEHFAQALKALGSSTLL